MFGKNKKIRKCCRSAATTLGDLFDMKRKESKNFSTPKVFHAVISTYARA